MKKLVSFLIIGIIVLSGLGAGAAGTLEKEKNSQKNQSTQSPYVDELDQSMTEFDGVLALGYAYLGSYINLSVAQSFIPQKELLTRTQFLMACNKSTIKPCVAAIRDNLTGENLATISLEPNEFSVVNGTPTQEQLGWIDINFDDLWVTPGQTYYIVVYTTNITGNFYWIAGNGTNIYPNGTVFLSVDNGNTWTEFTDVDGCFKTYGLRETFLNVSMKGGVLGTSFVITNIGNYTAWDVVVNISIKGGILRHINVQGNGNTSELLPGFGMGIGIGPFFGFGQIMISIRVSAANVKEIMIEKNAKILLFFIRI
ncbi:MAG TPA: hypothetical protein VMY59_10305 [Candidatus Thermoplasmatota archaeon]|nr:hypothetical protein [Candidatus Thermoplasmatota archaeon]